MSEYIMDWFGFPSVCLLDLAYVEIHHYNLMYLLLA